MRRIVESERIADNFRGLLPATGWLYLSLDRRTPSGGEPRGVLDFANGWTDSDLTPAQMCIDEHGRVRMRGRIFGGAIGTEVVQPHLPIGFRPLIPQTFILSNGVGGYANVEFLPDGTMRVNAVTGE